jgi:hypothetical protein
MLYVTPVVLLAVQLRLIWLLETAVALKLLGAAGPWVTPVPLTEAVCGLLEALSLIVNKPVLGPATVGLKLTLITQLAFVASDAPQLFVWEKSPVTATLPIVKPPGPLLVRVSVLAALVVPTF